MSYAINLYFNEEAEQSIMRIWESLALLNIGKCMSCTNGRPHITLAIYNDLDLTKAKEMINALAQAVHSFKLAFLQIGIFPLHKGTIFLTPNLTDDLFQVHRMLHDAFSAWEEEGWDYYKPQIWHPHCTLSMETPVEEIPKMLEEILKDFQSIEVTIESIGMASLDPIEYLCEFPLNKHEEQ
ncbi:2'-5' RNA ligase [Desulfitobacterium dehalogenans ATCC 51507]|uniref:2'-5' RNA ligase n=1 Tax=Desulfitobacterium dehalogenans (strain ATCC 51507 / DSM 9161 / JW/IU-DC1) TaxID=756499 RepID=I4AEQ6_DESDJ|nr:2'-5' RNA ligase family protein [Desulfitobacterium dehalogenans]AFM02441.1 2'-5' RNA ligase [Desulfitobacterium dehalogenans ATCC 51507]